MSDWTFVSSTSATTLKVGAYGSGPSRAATTQAKPGFIPGHAKPPASEKYFSPVSWFSYRTLRGLLGVLSPLTWEMRTAAMKICGASTLTSFTLHFIVSPPRQIAPAEERVSELPSGYECVVKCVPEVI